MIPLVGYDYVDCGETLVVEDVEGFLFGGLKNCVELSNKLIQILVADTGQFLKFY